LIEILNSTELSRAKDAGALVAEILQTLKRRSAAGTNLQDINRWAQAMITEAGAQSCYVDYEPSFGRGPFGHYICTSVNDAVLHGLPYDYTLADGDLLSLDLAVSKGGVVADSAISFIVGHSEPPESVAMISATERALHAGIAAAGPGARIGDVSHAIGSVLSEAGYPINTEFGGHGVGSTMHQDPHVPNTGRAGRGYRLRPGLLLALEPWVMADTAELVTDADGWTLRSATGCRTAHSEHTITITNDGAEILTLPTPAHSWGRGRPGGAGGTRPA
jgi:methionyl aminopeptidase